MPSYPGTPHCAGGCPVGGCPVGGFQPEVGGIQPGGTGAAVGSGSPDMVCSGFASYAVRPQKWINAQKWAPSTQFTIGQLPQADDLVTPDRWTADRSGRSVSVKRLIRVCLAGRRAAGASQRTLKP